jgi:hypothetical protein
MTADIHDIFARVSELPEARRLAWQAEVHRIRRTGRTLAEAVRAAGYPDEPFPVILVNAAGQTRPWLIDPTDFTPDCPNSMVTAFADEQEN